MNKFILNFSFTDSASVHSNNITPDIDEAEMMEIKTEPNQSDVLYSDGEYANMVDINSNECVTEGK